MGCRSIGEYRDVVGLFQPRRRDRATLLPSTSVDVKVRSDGGEVYFDVTMTDAWVWDIYRRRGSRRRSRGPSGTSSTSRELARPISVAQGRLLS